MKTNRIEDLILAGASGSLTEDEARELDALLKQSPELKKRWEEEQALDRLMRSLPEAALSSNFTAQTLNAVRAESIQPISPWNIRRWLPLQWKARLAWPRLAAAAATVAISICLWSGVQWRQHQTRAQYAESLAWITEELAALTLVDASPAPSNPAAAAPHGAYSMTLTAINDFESISRIPPIPAQQDADLLAALTY